MAEMAICSLTVILSILGVMECSRALYVEHSINSAAHDAARYAMVRGAAFAGTACATTSTYACDATSSNVTAYVTSILPPGIDTTLLNVTTNWPGTSASGGACDTTLGSNSAGCTVQVTLTYPFTFLLPLPSTAAIQFKSDAAVTIAQ
jgi:Flp pilus assembly protein TadG